MKEVRCIAIQEDDNKYRFTPYRVLIPESEIGKAEDSVDNVLNHVKDDYCRDVVTQVEGEQAERMWNSVDWDSAELVDPTPKDAEEAIDLWCCLTRGVRCKELEPIIATDDREAERYAANFPKSSWVSWEDEDLARSPYFLLMYAQQVMKGKLPEHLHAAMTMHSFRSPENIYIKKYFRVRRYKYHCKKNLRPTVRFCVGA
jgi:hypothetical protein